MKIKKFNVTNDVDISESDISYILQVFDEAIDMCQVRNLTPGSPWKMSNNQIFVGIDLLYNKSRDRNKILLLDDTDMKNTISLTFIYDKNVFILSNVSNASKLNTPGGLLGGHRKNVVTGDIGMLDFYENIFMGVKRLQDDKGWLSYYRIDNQTFIVDLLKIS